MRKRNQQIIVRLNDDEFALLKKKMEQSSMGYSDMFRMFIRDVPINVFPADEMKKLTTQISKIGGNINQLARVANSEQHVDSSILTTVSFQVAEAWRVIKDMAAAWR